MTHIAGHERETTDITEMSCDSMAAEEERIQRIVRQIVSSEIDGATPNCTNIELSSSSMALPMNVGGFQNTAEELRSRLQIPRSRSLPANRGPRALIPEERRQSPITSNCLKL